MATGRKNRSGKSAPRKPAVADDPAAIRPPSRGTMPATKACCAGDMPRNRAGFRDRRGHRIRRTAVAAPHLHNRHNRHRSSVFLPCGRTSASAGRPRPAPCVDGGSLVAQASSPRRLGLGRFVLRRNQVELFSNQHPASWRRGCPCDGDPACDGERRQDVEAWPAWSERRPGGPQRASGRRRVGNTGSRQPQPPQVGGPGAKISASGRRRAGNTGSRQPQPPLPSSRQQAADEPQMRPQRTAARQQPAGGGRDAEHVGDPIGTAVPA